MSSDVHVFVKRKTSTFGRTRMPKIRILLIIAGRLLQQFGQYIRQMECLCNSEVEIVHDR